MAKRTDTSDKHRNDWLFLVIAAVVGAQLAILVVRWLRHTSRKGQKKHQREYLLASCHQPGTSISRLSTKESPRSNSRHRHDGSNSPDPIVKDLYLEITNIAQGTNIAIFVYVITTRDFSVSFTTGCFSAPIFAITSLLIVIIFWARYYLDTEILNRSFTVLSTSWFFAYVVAQGVSISLISIPAAWLGSTGVFLFFGAGFYGLNLREIRRKQRAGVMPEWPDFVNWQTKRMLELIVLSLAAATGAVLVAWCPALALPAAICAFIVSIWQIIITRDYRRFGFLETGV